jgi:hypothetical protein
MLFDVVSRNSGERIACGVIGIRRPVDRLPMPQQTQRTMMNQRPMTFVPTFRQQQGQPMKPMQ